jgi:hypothetical protein
MTMYRLTAFMMLLLSPSIMVVAQTVNGSDCTSELTAVTTCLASDQGTGFSGIDSEACATCSQPGNFTGGTTSCDDIKSAVCNSYTNCIDACFSQGQCSAEWTNYYNCIISISQASTNCQFQCNGSNGGSGTTSSGPDRFMGHVATAAIPVLLFGGLVI